VACLIDIQEEVGDLDDFFFLVFFFCSFILCGNIWWGYLFSESYFFFIMFFFFFNLILGFSVYKSYGVNILLRVRGSGKTSYLILECFFDILYIVISFVRG
jgi:hypothetical protein